LYFQNSESEFRDVLKQKAAVFLQESSQALQSARDAIAGTAFGGINGQKWHEGFRPKEQSIIEFFNTTLDKIDASALDRKTKVLKEASLVRSRASVIGVARIGRASCDFEPRVPSTLYPQHRMHGPTDFRHKISCNIDG
jgi:hypothetical protein